MTVSKAEGSVTPLMKQYNAIKDKHPDAILLFRVGDFYETFGKDAITASTVLGITLTKRHNGFAGETELAGFPYHSIDNYLPKLVRAGHRVAVCDQLEDPKLAKKIVKRGVTELVTPGVTFNDDVLDKKQNNFLATIHFSKELVGMAFLDVSTGEFFIAEGNAEYAEKLLQNFKPKEIIFSRNSRDKFEQLAKGLFYSYPLDDWAFSESFSKEKLTSHFGVNSLKGFGIESLNVARVAAAAAIEYLHITRNEKLPHISHIERIDSEKYVWMDKFTIRNLELLNSPNEEAITLIDIMDECMSPMGSRLLRKWMIWPLKSIDLLKRRHDLTDYFISEGELASSLREEISIISDLERLISKVSVGKAGPRDINQLKKALSSIEKIQELFKGNNSEIYQSFTTSLNPCTPLIERIGNELREDAPAMLGKGQVIASGVNSELDELRKLQSEGKNYLLEMQKRETERTGISSLKVAFNNVFGYYIEVRNTHKDKVPEEWIRKQTLVSAERYITEELKSYEEKILGAEEKIIVLEAKLFNELLTSIEKYIAVIQKNASLIAELDCILNFSAIAVKYNYTKPVIDDSLVIDIKDGRHPVIERQMEVGEDYIPNDVYLDNQNQQILMITGPNMAGKSALLRQTALITLMAQMGSFVPAKYAKIGLVDKIFTRVGASDNISKGESTFMVEMNETASILNNISERSLILLDEIGRGTSTYDGISIAWSIAEFLHENKKAQPKTLFATHYHELNEMGKKFERIKNFNVSIKELENRVIFLRKLKPGGSEHSFGIHVAKMAGMPNSLITRAYEVMKQLESSHIQSEIESQKSEEKEFQLSFFQLDDPVLQAIKDELIGIDINNLTPVEALMKLNDIKKMLGAKD